MCEVSGMLVCAVCIARKLCVHVYVCMCMCVCVHVYVCMCAFVWCHILQCMCVCICECIHVLEGSKIGPGVHWQGPIAHMC